MAGTPNTSTSTLTLTAMHPLLDAAIGLKKMQIPVALAGLAGTAKVVDNLTFGHAGRITAIKFVTTVPASTGSKAATITPSLGGTNITGGVLALTTATCTAGAVFAGTAITALNSFSADTAFDLTLSSVTAFAEGSGFIEVTYVNTDERDFYAKMGLLFDE
jgi:hypothetical protein